MTRKNEIHIKILLLRWLAPLMVVLLSFSLYQVILTRQTEAVFDESLGELTELASISDLGQKNHLLQDHLANSLISENKISNQVYFDTLKQFSQVMHVIRTREDETNDVEDIAKLTNVEVKFDQLRLIELQVLALIEDNEFEAAQQLYTDEYFELSQETVSLVNQIIFEEQNQELFPILEQGHEDTESTLYNIILASILVAVLLLVFTFYAANRISEPLRKITQQLHQTDDSNLDQVLKADSNIIELRLIVKVINSLKNKIDETLDSLEDQVATKTKELNKKVKHLEKFRSVTIDTEIYAENLRVENEALKKKLQPRRTKKRSKKA